MSTSKFQICRYTTKGARKWLKRQMSKYRRRQGKKELDNAPRRNKYMGYD